jgi:hypothetical protein
MLPSIHRPVYHSPVVIDLSRKPVFVNTDVCTGWFVIRTASNDIVDGLLRRRLEKREYRKGRMEKHAGNNVTVVLPEARVIRGKRTLLECRLPVEHVLRRKNDEPMPNPFEVATLYTDAVTKQEGSWRVQLILERWKNQNGDLWLVTVRDENTATNLIVVTMKSIEEEAHGVLGMHKDDQLPLQRVTTTQQPAKRLNVWDRLRSPDLAPDLELEDPDEEPSS